MKECAAKLGIPYTTYVNYETGTREPNSEMLVTLADFFNTSVDYLIGRDDPKDPAALTQQLEGIDFALFGEVKDLTDEQKQDILDYIQFKKARGNKK